MKHSTKDSQAAIAAVEHAYQARRTGGSGPDWLAPLQDKALAAFTRRGFPTVRHEDWKYTNLARLTKASGELLSQSLQAVNAEQIDTLLERIPRQTGDYTLVFVNGRFDPARSELPGADTGISITTVSGAAGEDRARMAEWIDSDASSDSSEFAALNAAFTQDGVIVDIQTDARPAASLHIVFATDGQPIGTQPRLLVNAGERSASRIFEHHVSCGPAWTNAVSELRCANSARLTYVKLQDEDLAADHIAAQHVLLHPDSHFRAAHIDLGARLARNDLHVRMTGRGSHAELFGLFLVDGRRHIDNHTRTDHIAGNTVSREHYRGIMSEQGRGVFNGKIIVHEGADGTNAELNNRNMLLDNTAEIDTKPELEIYTDDVKCAHGATTGQLDEQALFYLRARGISLTEAKHMLVLAFARAVLEQFDPSGTELIAYLNASLERRLPE